MRIQVLIIGFVLFNGFQLSAQEKPQAEQGGLFLSPQIGFGIGVGEVDTENADDPDNTETILSPKLTIGYEFPYGLSAGAMWGLDKYQNLALFLSGADIRYYFKGENLKPLLNLQAGYSAVMQGQGIEGGFFTSLPWE